MDLSSLRFSKSGSLIIKGRNSSRLRHLDSHLQALSTENLFPVVSVSLDPSDRFLSGYFSLPPRIQSFVAFIFKRISLDNSLFQSTLFLNQFSFHARCLRIPEYSVIASQLNPTDFFKFFLYTYYSYVFRFNSCSFRLDELPF